MNMRSNVTGSTDSDDELLLTEELHHRKKRNTYFRADVRGDDVRINKYVIYILVGIILILLIVVIKNEFQHYSTAGEKSDYSTKKTKCNQVIYCKDPLNIATKGKWVKKSNTTTPWIQENITTMRRKFNLPENMARKDMRCGLTAPIPNTRLPALCDPNSDIYCCAEASGWCGNTPDHCTPHGTFNTRLKIPLSQAVWIPDDKTCQLSMFNQDQACAILGKGAKKIVFLGDSQARHFFTALMLFLSGNYKNGAIKKTKKSDKYIIENCTYEYQLLNKNCRNYIVKNSKNVENLCDGEYVDIDVEYLPDYQSFLGKKTTEMITKLQKQKNSYVIIGAGTHLNSDYNSFVNYYLRSIVQKRTATDIWPALIIETLPNVYSYKSNEKRWQFNQELGIFLHSNKHMSLYHNSLLTEYLESHDGRTYGLKFNMLKVQILLHYFYNTNPKCI